MSYAGSVHFVFDGDPAECAKHIPRARTLVPQAQALAGKAWGTASRYTLTSVLDGGGSIAITIAPSESPHITISVPDVVDEVVDYESLLPVKPYVLAYGFVGPRDELSVDDQIGNPLFPDISTELEEQLGTPLPDNYRIIPDDEWAVLPGGPESVWRDTFAGTADKFVEMLVDPTGTVIEGVSGPEFLEGGFVGEPAIATGIGVWRVVLEYPGLGELLDSSKTIDLNGSLDINAATIKGVDPVFGEDGTQGEDIVLGEGVIEGASFTAVGAVGSGLVLVGLPADLADLEPVPEAAKVLPTLYSIDGYTPQDWEVLESFTGSGVLDLPAYADTLVALDQFKKWAPYGEWVIAGDNSEIDEVAGRVTPDGRLEGFPESVLLPESPTTVRLHIRGHWGRVRIDIGVRHPDSGKIIWPRPALKQRVNYTVAPIPSEPFERIYVTPPSVINGLSSPIKMRSSAGAYNTGGYFMPKEYPEQQYRDYCIVFTPSTSDSVTRLTGLQARASGASRDHDHDPVSEVLPTSVFEFTGVQLPDVESIDHIFEYQRDLEFNPNLTASGYNERGYHLAVRASSCPGLNSHVTVATAATTSGSTYAFSKMTVQAGVHTVSVERELSDSYSGTINYSQSGIMRTYPGYPGWYFAISVEPFDIFGDVGKFGVPADTYPVAYSVDSYSDVLRVNNNTIDLIAVAAQAQINKLALYKSSSGGDAFNSSHGDRSFSDFALKALRIAARGARAEVTCVVGSGIIKFMYSETGWQRVLSSSTEVSEIEYAYEAAQPFSDFPEPLRAVRVPV